ncbi:MAG: DUF6600 domain-containing protein [Terracidiphilus sp.]|jgi:hypothetical protein
MRIFAFASARRLCAAIAAASFLTIAYMPLQAQDDPPAQAGRISSVSGTVSIQMADSDDWGQAQANFPLGPGDRIFTDRDGRAEIQVGQTFVRIGPNSDVSFANILPIGIWFGVAQGSVHIHCAGLWDGQVLHVNTPNGSASVSRPADFRVDAMPDQGAAIITDFASQVFVSGAGDYGQLINQGQALELAGSNPVTPQWLQPAEWDSLDRWSSSRDQQIAHAASYNYVSPEIPGGYELDASGTWLPGTDYGPIWFPNNVSADWAPYRYGHWVNHAPWGSVWVEDESWGYAPFHYGRWVNFQGRWGWVPGPPAVHPVWSPALVVFAGGIHVGGAGVSVWFPLGPGEVYRPWYHTSPHYIDQINITNIGESRRVHVQTTYVNINIVNVAYVNRTVGVSAMRHEDFAAGRSAHGAAVAVDAHQLDHAQVLDRPEIQANPHPFAGHPPARPMPVSNARPVLINETGKLVSTRPGAQPVEPPVKAVPPIKALPGHAVVAPPPGAKAPVTPAPAAAQKPSGRSPADTYVKPTPPPAATPITRPAVPSSAVPVTPFSGRPSTPPNNGPAIPAKPTPATPPNNGPTPPPTVPPSNRPSASPSAAPVVPPSARPITPPSAKPATPPSGKPQQDKKNEKDKKDEKKPQS